MYRLLLQRTVQAASGMEDLNSTMKQAPLVSFKRLAVALN